MLEVRDVLWMLLGVVPSHDGTVVTRAVVHEQQFPGLISLGENAQYGVLDESFRIEERNDYGDERLGAHDVKSSRSAAVTDQGAASTCAAGTGCGGATPRRNLSRNAGASTNRYVSAEATPVRTPATTRLKRNPPPLPSVRPCPRSQRMSGSCQRKML